MKKRVRMIFDLPLRIQMAIRLRAIKDRCKTADVIQRAVERAFPDDILEASKWADSDTPGALSAPISPPGTGEA